ncbi:MAG: (d)CMP kinase [Betaproteobacteria bacterium]|nr:(d)CMP kinase [Betaproteobacteria bacterium]
MNAGPIPVIAIDGPSASGKGTVAKAVARALGFHLLDSGALYRLVALAALNAELPWNDEPGLARLALGLQAGFRGDDIMLENQIVTENIRSEACSEGASIVGAVGGVRRALLRRQRAFRQIPGLVADGRDMGTVVFPDADLKIYLTASVEVRAERRYKQLKQKGIAATLTALLKDLRERDERDMLRSAAPLKPSPEAHILDTTALTAEAAADRVLAVYRGLRNDAI